ncbi:MAG: DUF11 domain-containing protein [Candidatus Saccharibacteria bacterium]|nr:DUF11 domain-containing protein [Candidatus Saccharibacteria bacterium]
MGKIQKSYYQRNSFRFGGAVLAMAFIAMIPAAQSFAWGPERTTYTMQQPPTHAVFNSITDNPDVGDERNFLRVRDADEKNWATGTTNGWTDTIDNMQAGHTYEVRLYVHNNGEEGKYMASGVRARINLPTGQNVSGKQFEINGYLNADNATPTEIWDNIVLKSDKDFHVKVVSAKYYNNVRTEKSEGFALGNELFTTNAKGGALLGYDQMNGFINSCLPYSGYILVKIQPVFEATPVSSFDVSKTVDKTTAKPGDTLTYTITARNTGTTDLTNVKITDLNLRGIDDSAIKYEDGNVKVTGSFGKDGNIVLDKLAAGETYTLTVSIVMKGDDGFECGQTKIENEVIGSTDQTQSEDDLTNNLVETVIDKTCGTVPPEEEEPGVPEAGVSVKTAVVSLVAFLGCALVLVKVLMKKQTSRK